MELFSDALVLKVLVLTEIKVYLVSCLVVVNLLNLDLLLDLDSILIVLCEEG